MHRFAVLGLAGVLTFATLPAADADAKRGKVLRKGSHGELVKALQRGLTRAGFRTVPDGAFGPATRESLMHWERWRHRRVNGVATKADRKALWRSARFGTRTLRVGYRGRDVRSLQRHLGRVGHGTAVDGAFGPMTRSAVMSWERSRGRGVNGVATRPDQHALRRGKPGGGGNQGGDGPRPRAWISSTGLAHISNRAPRRIQRLIRAGNRIAKKPYKYGGGHGRWNDSGYDCSGSVSYVLHHAGMLRGPARASGGFTSWGKPGRGRWVTVYAHGGHMFLTVAGLRFDTTDRERDGTRWHKDMRSGSGYAVRRPGL
ncbi:MAG TPA: peptidoglycan-binding protein [Thermoleophilaceae bacterium]|nr:peptidoglycan-binding protein [Thermoleophilaceae bacterium]